MKREDLKKLIEEAYIEVLQESLIEDLAEAEEDEEPDAEEAGAPEGEEVPESEPGTEEELPDATDTILGRFPTLKQAIVKLQTEDYEEFVDSIDWISPRPTAFRINLKNGQDYELKWTGKTFVAKILGKRYTLSNIADYQQALDKLAILYSESPMKGAGEGEAAEGVDDASTGGGDFPGGEGGATGGEEDFGGEEGGEDLGGADVGGGEDLSDEPIDFEDGAEPEA
jgi:hypothetical protein